MNNDKVKNIELKNFLKWRRMSIKDFADYVEVSQSTVRSWISGRTYPSMENFIKIYRTAGDYAYDFFPEKYKTPEANLSDGSLSKAQEEENLIYCDEYLLRDGESTEDILDTMPSSIQCNLYNLIKEVDDYKALLLGIMKANQYFENEEITESLLIEYDMVRYSLESKLSNSFNDLNKIVADNESYIDQIPGYLSNLQYYVDRTFNKLDPKLRDYKSQQRREKRNRIYEIYKKWEYGKIDFYKIFNPNWDNEIYDLETINNEMHRIFNQIIEDIKEISLEPKRNQYYALERYRETLNIKHAISYAKVLIKNNPDIPIIESNLSGYQNEISRDDTINSFDSMDKNDETILNEDSDFFDFDEHDRIRDFIHEKGKRNVALIPRYPFFDKAFIGVSENHKAVYDYDLLITEIMKENSCDLFTAKKKFYTIIYNIIHSNFKELPLFIHRYK